MLLRISLLAGLAVLACAADAPPRRPAPGDVLWRLDLGDPAKRPGPLPAGASWAQDGPGGTTSLHVTVPAGQPGGMTALSIPLDLKPWRGAQVSLLCQAKGDGVTTPAASYNGIKCMLHWKSASSGEHWLNQGNVHGTFDWKELATAASIDDDADSGQVVLGMQDCTGSAALAEVRIVALAFRPVRPPPRADAPPPFRGHDLPRLRGVMSPNVFREADFVDLEKLKVNAMRWQICRNWGAVDSDRDGAEYDRWLDGRLDELALALDSARRHGIRLLIDLHSPPGGRLADGTMRMLLEREHQDHFVAIWKRIATRFAGHPAVWGYDLINEPVQNKPSPPGLADWLGIQVLAAKAVRTVDPLTAIAIEVDGWDSPDRFAWLEPVDVPRVIYEAHMYWPHTFTHQGVHKPWGEPGGDPRTTYPGPISGVDVDQAALRRFLQPVRDFQLAYGVHVVIGEFSAVRWAPGAERYLADCSAIFEDYGWDWTYHAFREWGGWSFEAADAPYSRDSHPRAAEPTARAQALSRWYALDVRAP